jgi:exonuclease VII small subunit
MTTTATDPHVFAATADAANVCAHCGFGPNVDVHADPAMSKSIETEERAQMALEEKERADPALEGALRSFMEAKNGIEKSRETLKNADKLLTGMVGDREMPAGTYRQGPYVMKVSDVSAHQRISVKLAKTP